MNHVDLFGTARGARTSLPSDSIRCTTALAAILVGLLLLASALAESPADAGSAANDPGMRITFTEVIDVREAGEADTPVEPEPVVEQDLEPESDSLRSDELDTVLSVVREHRATADALWCYTLAEAIYAESVASDVDPLLITSIVAVESSFQSQVVSQKGAVGLMQLRPFVAEDVALRQNIEWAGHETLHTPHLNLRMGISYYKRLLDRFDGDATMALTAYNYGPTRVSRAVRSGSYSGSEYAARVLRGYEALRSGRTWPASRRSQS